MYKLLVVDDEQMIRDGIAFGINWKAAGISAVFTAESASSALEFIEREAPEIMLTDIRMAQKTGLDLIDTIRNEMKNDTMRILVLTGYDSFDYARSCLQMRVQNFLLKPADEEVLEAEVCRQIEALDEMKNAKEIEEKKVRTVGTIRQAQLEQYMRDVIHKRVQNGLKCPEEIAGEKDCFMQLAFFIPDIHMGAKDSAEESLRQLTVLHTCMSFVDAKRVGVTFSDDDGTVICVFYTGDGEGEKPEIVELSVTERIREIAAILEDEYKISPKVILGSKVAGMERLFISYNDARYLLSGEKTYEKITKVPKEQDREVMIRDVYGEFKQEMISQIANGERVLYVFEKLRQAAAAYNISRAQTQKWCFEIYADLYFTYIQETGQNTDQSVDGLLHALTGVSREEALEVTENYIRSLVFRENTEQNDNIMKAKRYIDEHLETDLSVSELSEKFSISPNYFSRLFKKVVGESCNEYIVKKRMEKSKLLLETTTIKTGKIALMVGYNDANYFSLAFRKNVGMSPTKYREMKFLPE